MSTLPHILFVIPSLRMGGAERVASLLCNDWVAQGYSVSVITFDSPDNDFFALSPSIRRYVTGFFYTQKTSYGRLLFENVCRLIRLFTFIRRIHPDCVVSFMDVPNVLSVLACLPNRCPVIISERTYPPFFPRGRLIEALRRKLYPLAHRLVCQTKEVEEWAHTFMPSSKTTVIANPLPQHQIQHGAIHYTTQKIIALGRLSSQKGFDLLIKAAAMVCQKHPDWTIDIIGEGEERPHLEALIERYALTQHVTLRGAHKDPTSLFPSASIFVLSSRVEGFPNALLEAMASGLAPISFACKCGPKDIIEHNVNGFLVKDGDSDGLAHALCRLIDDFELRQRLGQAAKARVQTFDLTTISRHWLALIHDAIHERSV